jgi:hypothetical protein
MSPIISVAESFPLWVFPVQVIFILIYLGFIKRVPAAAKVEKQIPSPKGILGLGNILENPSEQPWMKFAQLAKKLGPIFQLHNFDQTHIVVSDEKIAQELLEKRGLLYSNRPWVSFTSGLLTGNLHLLLLSNSGMSNVAKHNLCITY